jgi:hypothetical protein
VQRVEQPREALHHRGHVEEVALAGRPLGQRDAALEHLHSCGNTCTMHGRLPASKFCRSAAVHGMSTKAGLARQPTQQSDRHAQLFVAVAATRAISLAALETFLRAPHDAKQPRRAA